MFVFILLCMFRLNINLKGLGLDICLKDRFYCIECMREADVGGL